MGTSITALTYDTSRISNFPPTIQQAALITDAPIAEIHTSVESFDELISIVDGTLGTNLWQSITMFSGANENRFKTDYPFIYSTMKKIYPALNFLRLNQDVDPSPWTNYLYLPNGYMFDWGWLDLFTPYNGNFGDDMYVGWCRKNGSTRHRNLPFSSTFTINTSGNQVRTNFTIIPQKYFNGNVANFPLTDTIICPLVSINCYFTDDLNDIERISFDINLLSLVEFSSSDREQLNNYHYTTLSNDPYSPGGTSGGGGGGGSFTHDSTPIGLPGLPTIQATDTGFLTLYNPSVTQIKALSDYMWSTGFSLDDFKKIFADPISAILGLQLVPVSVPNGSAKEVKIGNIATGVFMFPVTTQWVTHSCGSMTIPEYWGAYLDFNPYTTLQIFLPYIGVRSINADDIIGKPLELQYNVDVLSGACVASLASNGTTLYNWQGSCGLQIPFTSNTFSNLLGSILQVAGAGVTIAGASSMGAVAAAGLSAVSGLANAQKNDIQHGGNISGAGGLLGVQTPYIILSRPSLCLPFDQNKFIGYPSYISTNLSELTGMTMIESIHIENVPATAAELEEIESLLKSGVIF